MINTQVTALIADSNFDSGISEGMYPTIKVGGTLLLVPSDRPASSSADANGGKELAATSSEVVEMEEEVLGDEINDVGDDEACEEAGDDQSIAGNASGEEDGEDYGEDKTVM